MKDTTQKNTLHSIYLASQKSRDIADNIFDWVNCFEVAELETSANKNNIDDDCNNVLLWFADNIETTSNDSDYIHCNITEFIEENRAIFDEFLNQVYREEYQPQNIDKIESDSEEFYDYYLEDVFGGLINGTFSDSDYSLLWRIICNHRANKSTLKKNLEKMTKMSQQIDALHYARYLISEKHNNALDMVQNVPQNIYIEDWKKEEKNLAKKCEYLSTLEDDLQHELEELCNAIEQERKEQRQMMDNYFISHLSSAYQESAIFEAVDTFNDGETMNAQEFADLCCENYREQLGFAGFKGMTGASSIYKGFSKYGDETQMLAVAFVVFGIITR